jgi:hypothetical protein
MNELKRQSQEIEHAANSRSEQFEALRGEMEDVAAMSKQNDLEFKVHIHA